MPEEPRQKKMSVDEYLEFEESSSIRHEYFEGEVFAMTGTTNAHEMICQNVQAALYNHLDGTPCRVQSGQIKVQIKAADCFYYPDVLVTCERFEPQERITKEPVLIIEVLSSSTQHIDRREKLINYRKLDSLHEYVLIHQNKVLIEFWRKDAAGTWTITEFAKPDEIVFESIPQKPLTMTVQHIYKGLNFPYRVKENEEEYEYDPSAN